jgi:hypothetical protein
VWTICLRRASSASSLLSSSICAVSW